jgi:hypothetical protein
MLNLIALHHAVLGYDFFQEQTKFWNIPYTVAQFIKQLAFGIVGIDLECPTEGAARGDNAQILVEYQERLPHSGHNCLGEYTSVFQVRELFSEHD